MTGRKRPFLVWIIFLGYVTISVANIGLMFLLTSGLYDLSPEQRALLAGMSVFDRIIGYILAAMLIVGAFLLFRLKKRAVPVLALTLVLDVAGKLMTIVNHHMADTVAPAALAGQFVGSFILLLVCVYARSLGRRGVLT